MRAIFAVFLGLLLSVPGYAKDKAKVATEGSGKAQEAPHNPRDSVVSVKVFANSAAYDNAGESVGTAFYVGNGLFCTNLHIIGQATVATYKLIFESDGSIVEAAPAWSDPLYDFGFLRVKDKSKLPKDLKALKITTGKAKRGDKVVVFGSSGGKAGAMHPGFVADVNHVTGNFGDHSYMLSINTHQGASGSPVLNKKGEVLGIIYAGDGRGAAYAIRAEYLNEALKTINDGKKPPRKTLGVFVKFQAIDMLKDYLPHLEKAAKGYSKKYPSARKKVLTVRSVAVGSPAEKAGLKPGDVLWKMNGKEIANDLFLYRNGINTTTDKLELTVLNEDGEKKVKIAPDMLYDGIIDRLLEFGGGVFYEVDPFTSKYSGLTDGVLLSRISQGSFMNRFYFYSSDSTKADTTPYLLMTAIEFKGKRYRVKTLDDMVEVVKMISRNVHDESKTDITKANFRLFYRTQGAVLTYDYNLDNSKVERVAYIEYTADNRPPRLSKFDEKAGDWTHHMLAK